jgi:hypothetical protein
MGTCCKVDDLLLGLLVDCERPLPLFPKKDVVLLPDPTLGGAGVTKTGGPGATMEGTKGSTGDELLVFRVGGCKSVSTGGVRLRG